ncbi:MAG: sugar O-acetyltransferase [Elusimicrobiales bacterium]|nr:sugar O-acetyltransferase [Elusimicrobiales bacterium]
MNQKERMLAGLPYRAGQDGLPQEQLENKRKIYEYNLCRPDEIGRARALLKDILGVCGNNVTLLAPFRCDYGKNIEIADDVFINYNCVILDVARVVIGRGTLFGPNVCICTAGHPVHPLSRRSGYEYGAPVTIGRDVWLGANVVITPGVTVGYGSVIGAGSVVTKDVPPNVIAVGNPCRVLRKITDADRDFYFKDKKFDVIDY